MRLHILSDLHMEFGPFELPEIERDVLILAGDTHLGLSGLDLIKRACDDGPVIMVLGNHEYYKHEMCSVLEDWRAVDLENFHVLENNSIIIGGIRFLGCTLWTDMHENDPDVVDEAIIGLSDYSFINKGAELLHPDDTIQMFSESLQFLKNQMGKPFAGKTIIISHYLPSEKSIALEFANDPLNYTFYTNLDSFILETRPDLWIHGHTHHSFDYSIGSTRIVCNPRGYAPNSVNPRFDPEFIIEI